MDRPVPWRKNPSSRGTLIKDAVNINMGVTVDESLESPKGLQIRLPSFLLPINNIFAQMKNGIVRRLGLGAVVEDPSREEIHREQMEAISKLPFRTKDIEVEGEYLAEEILEWERRGRKFNNFWQRANIQVCDSDLEGLQALFLGEKPATLFSDIGINSSRADLSRYAFKVFKNIIYDPRKVESLMEEHPDLLSKYDSPEAYLEDVTGFEEKGLELGLLMGYPRKACEDYVRRHFSGDRLRINEQLKSLGFDSTEVDDFRRAQGFATFMEMKVGEEREKVLEIVDYLLEEQLRKVQRVLKAKGKMALGAMWVLEDGDPSESYRKADRLRAAFHYSRIKKEVKVAQCDANLAQGLRNLDKNKAILKLYRGLRDKLGSS